MSNKRFIALDPGGTTGTYVLDVFSDGSIKHRAGQIGPEEHHVSLDKFLFTTIEPNTTIICEDFNNRANAAASLISLEYIGIVKLVAAVHGIPLTMQMSSVKNFSTDEKLRACGLWVPSMKHARDAGRHLLKYMVDHERNSPCTRKWLLALKALSESR